MMYEDRNLFGAGPYPATGPLAALARVAFLLSAAGIVFAVYARPPLDPHFARSRNVEHFAAFYVAALFGLAALPRMRLRAIGAGYMLFATLLEAAHLLRGWPIESLVASWTADLGGLAAAAAPVVIERFRRRLR